MQSYLFFLGRYEIGKGPVLHTSSSCTVLLAADHGDDYSSPAGAVSPGMSNSFQVVLKFMRYRDEFEREIYSRIGTSEKHVVPVIASYAESKSHLSGATSLSDCVTISNRYASDCTRMELGSYPYLLVLPACTFSLADMILHGHISSSDRESIRSVIRDLALAVGELHKLGRIHGDVKPLNILRRY